MPTTAAGAEICLLVVALGIRWVDIAQTLLIVPIAWATSPSPRLGMAAVALLVAESCWLTSRVLRTGQLSGTLVGMVDLLTGMILLGLMPLTVRPDHLLNSWVGWPYAVSLTYAVVAAVVFWRGRHVALAVMGLAVVYVASALPVAPPGGRSTVLTNAVSYAAFGGLPYLMARYLRRLAADADEAREESRRLGAQAERDRQRLLLHDQETVLSMLSDQPASPELAGALRDQAARGALQIRAFLRDDDVGQLQEGTLASLLQDVATEFTDLPLDLNLVLARAALPPQTLGAVRLAVRTSLHNVRRHAGANSVVIHAEVGPDSWEVTVRDDGCGFDPDEVQLGFGLVTQVQASIAAVGGSASVETAPGCGTAVVLRGSAC